MDTKPVILALETTVPENYLNQKDLGIAISEIMKLDHTNSQWLNKLYRSSGIEKRHTVLHDFQGNRSQWIYWDENNTFKAPGTEIRNEIYKVEAPKLAFEAAKKALDQWGGDYKTITHLIFVSCTGMIAPGVQHFLTHHLPLNSTVNQMAINFMGCFGAFKGIDLATAYAQQNDKHRILVVCTEICSLHLQFSMNPELQIANALFADGAAALIIGCNPTENEKPLWKIAKSKSFSIPNTEDKMTWQATNQGFCMGLKSDVPELIKKNARSFVESIVPDGVAFSDCDWPIHPGGKGILKAIEDSCGLNNQQTGNSWKVLSEYGNMSSPTFLFVLKELFKKHSSKEWAIGLGFGPGLTIEGVLLQNCGTSHE